MKKPMICTAVLLTLLSITSISNARDSRYVLPIADAMNAASGKLNGSVKFYFGDQAHPRILQNLGTDVSNPKTNSFGKSDKTACQWVFLSAMKSLQNRAQKLGANAVVNIVSYYDKNVMSSPDQYECHAGSVVAGVALKGDFVKTAV